jgi:hypothetical protein
MSDHKTHDQHSHTHGPGCGHTAVKHEGHVDYLHEGHLHMPCRRVARIRPLVRRLMLAVRTTVSTIMGLVVDMRRYRTAVIPTTSSKATCIIRIKGTATITALSLWPDDFGTGRRLTWSTLTRALPNCFR